MFTVKCSGCGLPFSTKRASQKFCSHACSIVPGAKKRKAPVGTGSVGPYGYRYIRVGGRKVFEHRHVMEQHIGRPLDPTEVVHHKDGDRLNNSIENLELLPSQSAHTEYQRIRFADATHKECCRCETIKPRSDFNLASKNGHGKDPNSNYCRQCQAEYAARRKVEVRDGCSECGRLVPTPYGKRCSRCYFREYNPKRRRKTAEDGTA